jgi:hypothetical protein
LALEFTIGTDTVGSFPTPQPERTMSDDADDTPEAPPPSRFVWEEGDIQIIRPGEPGYTEPGDIPPGEDVPEGAFDDDDEEDNGE